MTYSDCQKGYFRIILIQEHDNHNIAESLREDGHHVVECPDGKKALKLFQTGDFHLVLNGKQLPKWVIDIIN